MNTNESNNKGTVICSRCSYDANPVGAIRCQKCGKHLVIASVPISNKVGKFELIPYVFLLFIALAFLIFGGFGYYYGSINTKTTALLKTLLGSKVGSVSPTVHSSRDYTVLVRDVASTPGAIGIGAAMLVATQHTVHPLALAPSHSKQYVPVLTADRRLNLTAFQNGTYPITRYLYVIIRRDARADERAGVAYANLLLSKEGQQFVEKAGLVPIR